MLLDSAIRSNQKVHYSYINVVDQYVNLSLVIKLNDRHLISNCVFFSFVVLPGDASKEGANSPASKFVV